MPGWPRGGTGRDERQLEGADDVVAPLGHGQELVRVAVDGRERGVVDGQVLDVLAEPSQRIVGEQGHDRRNVARLGPPDPRFPSQAVTSLSRSAHAGSAAVLAVVGECRAALRELCHEDVGTVDARGVVRPRPRSAP